MLVNSAAPSRTSNRERRYMWPPSFWLYPMMPWLIATRLPATFYAALLTPPPQQPTAPRAREVSAEIIPFPVRRAAAC